MHAIPSVGSGNAGLEWNAGAPAEFQQPRNIEQFARRQTGKLRERKTGDEIMDAYAECLPLDKRPNLPSLKHWYDKLSEPIHSAEDEAAERLFDNAREEIEHHFELRRALRISDQEAG